MVDYRKIIKQAYEIVKNNKFLWIFGLFLMWGMVFNSGLSIQNDPEIAAPSLEIFQTHPFWSNLIFLVVLFLIFQLLLLYFRSKAATISTVKAILDKQEVTFKRSFRVGGLFHWRLFGVTLILQLGLFILVLVLSIPVMHLVSIKLFTRAIILGAFGLMIFIPVSVLVSLSDLMAPMFVVLHDFKINESISRSFELVKEFWRTLVVLGIYLIVISLGVTVLGALAAGLASSPFVLLSYLAYHRGGFGPGWIYVSAAICTGGIVFLTVQAALASFNQTAWVLAFLELIKPQKIEEENPEPVPEIVS
jgi:hypothetical protein